MAALVRMQSRMDAQARTLPPYDDELLRREMALFPEWFCNRHLGLSLEDRHKKVIDAAFDVLVAEALRQPRVFVHRDYHSRNLMVGDGGRYGPNPGILDFQDAVYGPVTYDLVSLLKDCYVRWPTERVRGWLTQFREMAASEGLRVGATLEEFERWFDFMGLQRHLKVLGIFARLFHRDGKPGYLQDLPLTLEYVLEAAARHAELAPLKRLFDELVVPAFERVRAEQAP
jgi:aminoglycoside/choline kinase family phosphotransferase